jgi:alcohol dehydrogenase class IV
VSVPYEFHIATRIVYGRESAKQIDDIVTGLNLKKIQLVTDKGVADSGTLDYLLKPLKDAGINSIIYEDITYNPTVQSVDRAAEQFKNENCDGVIAVGGGSPIDAGK